MRRTLLPALLLVACSSGQDADPVPTPDAGRERPAPQDEPDAASSSPAGDSDVIPRFASNFHLAFEHVERISRFRAGLGHDYSDSYERCRTMKHYVCPLPCPGSGAPPPAVTPPPWTELEVRSPITGTVERLEQEQSYGIQVVLEPAGHPDFRVKLFHVAPASDLEPGSAISAGQVLGTHATTQTMSDIAVEQYRSDGFRLISFFETLDDDAFAALALYGITDRATLQIPADERDAAPLECEGEQYMTDDPLEHWVPLAR